MFSQRGEIVRIMIHVMAAGGLSGSAVTAPIMGDDAKAFADKEKHLCVPIVRRERPAVTEHDRLSFAPVLVIDVDVSSVFFSNCDVWHLDFPFRLGCMQKCAARGAIDRHDFDPLCAPRSGVEWVGKVLGFMRHFSIPKLHNAHGVDVLAFVDNHVLSDPEIALSHDPADRKSRWPARMMTTKRPQVTPTANYLA